MTLSPQTSASHLLTPALLSRLGRLEIVARQAVVGMLQAGSHRSRTLGAGQEFEQYRRYVPGDDLRQVDWRLFARSDQLHCRVQSPDTTARFAIVLDASASMGFPEARGGCSKLRCASVLAACMGFLASRQGDSLALFAYGESLEDASGRNLSFAEFCTRLESLKARGRAHAQAALASACDYVHGKGMVFWLSDFLGEEQTMENHLRAFQAAGKACYAMQVLSKEELELTSMGARRFQDPESGQEMLTEPQLIREEYLQRLQEFLSQVRQACLRQSVPFALVTPDTELGRLLPAFLASPMPR